MKVYELIARLKKFKPEAEVSVSAEESGCGPLRMIEGKEGDLNICLSWEEEE